MPTKKIVITSGRVIDPAQGIDRICDVLISGEKIEEITEKPLDQAPEGYEVIDASGLIVSPGFIFTYGPEAVSCLTSRGTEKTSKPPLASWSPTQRARLEGTAKPIPLLPPLRE